MAARDADLVAAAKRDPRIFVNSFCQGVDYEARPPVEFDATLRTWQGAILDKLASAEGGQKKIVLLKSRGVGATWAMIWYATWLLWARAPAQVLIMSDTEPKAWDLMRRHRFTADRLPASLEYPKPGGAHTDNLSSRTFPNGSEVHSLSGDPENIRSYHPTLIIVDEAAKLRSDPRPPLVGTQADIVMMSTADGIENPFAEVWQDAYAATGDTWGYEPLFVSWRDREDLQERPRGDKFIISQEYPETPEEAFTSSRGAVWTMFSKEKHVVKGFPIPREWPFIRGFDPGARSSGWVWVATAKRCKQLRKRGWPLPKWLTNGSLVVFDEYEPPIGSDEVAIEDQVREVLAKDSKDDVKPVYTAVDPSDAVQQTGRGLRTTAELAEDLGVGRTEKAPNDEKAFYNALQQDFLDRKICIMDHCKTLIRQIQADVWSEKSEDGRPKREHSEKFHTLAAFKYAYMMEPWLLIAETPQPRVAKHPTRSRTGY